MKDESSTHKRLKRVCVETIVQLHISIHEPLAIADCPLHPCSLLRTPLLDGPQARRALMPIVKTKKRRAYE